MTSMGRGGGAQTAGAMAAAAPSASASDPPGVPGGRVFWEEIMGACPSDGGMVLRTVLKQLAEGSTGRTKRGSGSSGKGRGRGNPRAKDWIAASAVCRAWAAACEDTIFRPVCQQRGWRPPRKPRAATQTPDLKFPWRGIYLKHACFYCSEQGEFGIRNSGLLRNCALQHLVCRRCVDDPRVQGQLVKKGLRVDLLSVSGELLIRKKYKNKRQRREETTWML
mmetsp:Transcript_10143/g.25730  ORF Transcript_10143/g.25730 Transcript_10143/m.25730 type:complete len:222 (-) Transcript_10143:594-1259(-)